MPSTLSVPGFAPTKTIVSSQGHAQLAAQENTAPKVASGPWRDYASIDEQRWNKSYPYQLLVLEANDNGGYSARTDWKFTLPIPPEALHVSTQFTTRTDAALEGVVEQNSGVRFRYISLRGTTGVMPLRPTAAGAPETGFGSAVFAGTVANFRAFTKNVQAAVDGSARSAPNLLDDEVERYAGLQTGKKIPGHGTGYLQFLLLERFLISYMEAKKKDSGKKLRLAFATWKTNTIYIVQPMQFEATKDASSPNEFRYNIRFKAWAKVDPAALGVADTEIVRPTSGRHPNLLADVLNRLTSARRALVSLNKTFASVRTDLASSVLNVTRQVTYFCKDALAIPATLADLPAGIASDFHDTFNRNSPTSFQQQLERIANKTDSEIKSSLDKVFAGPGQSEAVFTDTNEHFGLLSAIQPDMIPLPAGTLRKIEAERVRVAAFTRLDFEKMRDGIVQASAEFSDAVGAGSPVYDAVFGRTAVTSKTRSEPTTEDWETIFALNETALQIGRLASYADVGAEKTSPVEYIAGLASASNIAFTVPRSKFAVPFPYGATLEQVANRYLGSPERWHEIAALNNLRAPFVDEIGFDLPLLVNARGNTVVVDDASNLYLGQAVWLQAQGQARQKRHVQNIHEIGPGQVRILLDGDAVDQFTLAAGATLHASLPGTVNSQMLIFIPSTDSASEDGNTKGVVGVDFYDHLLRIGGMDLLLTPDRDLALGSDGDARIAQGLANITQIIGINFNLPRGALMRHPSLGFSIKVGSNTADVSAQDMLAAARSTLSAYSMFSGVESALVVKRGPTASVGLSIGLQGVDDLLKIAVDVAQ